MIGNCVRYILKCS